MTGCKSLIQAKMKHTPRPPLDRGGEIVVSSRMKDSKKFIILGEIRHTLLPPLDGGGVNLASHKRGGIKNLPFKWANNNPPLIRVSNGIPPLSRGGKGVYIHCFNSDCFALIKTSFLKKTNMEIPPLSRRGKGVCILAFSTLIDVLFSSHLPIRWIAL